MSLPDTPWIDDLFVSTILKKDLATSKQTPIVSDYKCDFATETGQNYSSILYRLKVNYHFDNKNGEIYKKSYIIKCMQSADTDVGQTMKSLGIFEKESTMYGETLKKIQQLIESVGLEFQVIPRLIHTITDPMEILVIEDLEASGFKVGNVADGFDREHCEMVMRKLGMMHAASMYLNRENVAFRSHYNRGCYYDGMPESLTTYFINGVTQAIEVMKQRPMCKKYVEFYEKYKDRFVRDSMEYFKSVPEDHVGFNVLNHGDLWFNNIMFKHDDSGKPIDVKFIDFQMSYFGCPGTDINYFFFTSPKEEVRSKYRMNLVTLYQSTVVEVLTKLNYDGPIPTLDDIHHELLKAKDIGLMTVCIVLPLSKIDKNDKDKMTSEGIMNKDTESDSRKSLYNNKIYQEALEAALKDLEDMKYLSN